MEAVIPIDLKNYQILNSMIEKIYEGNYEEANQK